MIQESKPGWCKVGNNTAWKLLAAVILLALLVARRSNERPEDSATQAIRQVDPPGDRLDRLKYYSSLSEPEKMEIIKEITYTMPQTTITKANLLVVLAANKMNKPLEFDLAQSMIEWVSKVANVPQQLSESNDVSAPAVE